jgi:hypothetical protein
MSSPKSFVPPRGAAAAARRGLALRAKFGRGGTDVGVARARGLSKRRALSLAQVAKIHSYHQRHAVDAQGEGWGSESDPSAGWIAYLLWGGAAAKKWANSIRAKHGTPSRPKRLRKGRAHKYLFKIPTGKASKTGKPLYRYLYKYTGARTQFMQGAGVKTYTDVNPSTELRPHIKQGASFRDAGHGQQHAGHWVVERAAGDAVTLRHDEDGRILNLTRSEAVRFLLKIHQSQIRAEAQRRDQRRARELHAAVMAYHAAHPQLPEDVATGIKTRRQRQAIAARVRRAGYLSDAAELDMVQVLTGKPAPDALGLGARGLGLYANKLLTDLRDAQATDRQQPLDLFVGGDLHLAQAAALLDRLRQDLADVRTGEHPEGPLAGLVFYNLDRHFTPFSDAEKEAHAHQAKLLRAITDVQNSPQDPTKIAQRVKVLIRAARAAYPKGAAAKLLMFDFTEYDDNKAALSRVAYNALLTAGVTAIPSRAGFAVASPLPRGLTLEALGRTEPHTLDVSAQELTSKLLAAGQSSSSGAANPDLAAKIAAVLGPNTPAATVFAPSGDAYNIPTHKLGAHVQAATRKGLAERAARHRAEVAPILAPIEAALKGDLLDKIERKILDDDAAALGPVLMGRGLASPQEFADAMAIARANPGMSLFSALAKRGVAVLSLAGKAPAGLIASTTESGRNLRRARALVDHFHREWGVPDTSPNAARIRPMAEDPSWGTAVQGGALPTFRADDFAAMVHPDVMPLIDVVNVKKIDPQDGAAVLRAFALPHTAVMDHRDDHATFWHEAAHNIETASKDIGRRVKDFMLHRLERTQDFHMVQTTPGKPDELGYQDGFKDAYTGRWYYRDGVGDEQGEHVSEALSMGMTYLGSDARAFAKRDPEHMALVLAALGGKLGLRDKNSDADAPAKVERRRKMGTFSLDALRAWHKKG